MNNILLLTTCNNQEAIKAHLYNIDDILLICDANEYLTIYEYHHSLFLRSKIYVMSTCIENQELYESLKPIVHNIINLQYSDGNCNEYTDKERESILKFNYKNHDININYRCNKLTFVEVFQKITSKYIVDRVLRNHNTIIVAGSPFIGKSYSARMLKLSPRKTTIRAFDIHPTPNEPNQSFLTLRQKIYAGADIIFVNALDTPLMKNMQDANMKYYLAYPQENYKDEYLSVLYREGVKTDEIEILLNNWNAHLLTMKNDSFARHIVLSQGETLYNTLLS